jgi:hypothetical protein
MYAVAFSRSIKKISCLRCLHNARAKADGLPGFKNSSRRAGLRQPEVLLRTCAYFSEPERCGDVGAMLSATNCRLGWFFGPIK